MGQRVKIGAYICMSALDFLTSKESVALSIQYVEHFNNFLSIFIMIYKRNLFCLLANQRRYITYLHIILTNSNNFNKSKISDSFSHSLIKDINCMYIYLLHKSIKINIVCYIIYMTLKKLFILLLKLKNIYNFTLMVYKGSRF